jgi:dolichol-phosphate mannosyltransferase
MMAVQELAAVWPVESPAVRVLVMVPTFNEAENIDEVLHRVRRAVPSADILVIDDGSPDGTAEMAEAVGQEIGRIEVLRRGAKSGLGSAYRAGFRAGLAEGYDVMVEMDADLSHDPDALPALIEQVAQGADLAIGSRYVAGGSIPDWKLGRRTISRVGCLYARVMLRLHVSDATAGFRAYHRRLISCIDLEHVRADGYGFQVEMTYQAERAGARIVEVPIVFRDRTLGRSKMSGRIVVEALLLVTRWGMRDRLFQVRKSYEELRARH